MKLLLDTHVFIWGDSEPEKLSRLVLELCQDPENTLFLSVASVWEMQIKSQLGKLRLSLPLAELINGQQKTNRLQILSIRFEHILELEKLPLHHKDPFDRLIIAQAADDPLMALDQARPDWRDTLPLPVEEETVKALLGNLVYQAQRLVQRSATWQWIGEGSLRTRATEAWVRRPVSLKSRSVKDGHHPGPGERCKFNSVPIYSVWDVTR